MSITIPPALEKQIVSGQDLSNVNSRTMLLWECDKSHQWKANVFNRINGTGCPYCSNRKVLVGFNDLTALYPHLAAEWHPTKNGTLKPTDVVAGGRQNIYWLGVCGHEWEASLEGRVRQVTGCPYCSNRKVLVGFNDLATVNPMLAKQWHPTKNDKLKPSSFTANTHTKVWWLGDCGHEWEASIIKRNSLNRGCHYCVNQKVLPGYNDLSTTNSLLAKEWHPTKNGELKPTEVVAGSNVKVWWQCKEGHSWEASLNKRTNMNRGCPYCVNQKVLEGYNDFGSTDSAILNEWHPTKNSELKPTEVVSGSNVKVWWLGDCGHEWEAILNERAGTHKTGCPKCPTMSSKAEKEISKMILMSDPDLKLEYGVKNVIKDYELDIYLPEKNIAIEYNGLYWHSDKIRQDTNYHYKKWQECQSKGIQLIQIWADDWENKKDLVTKLLRHKLEISSEEKVYARNTYVYEIGLEEANNFLNDNHIQGSVNGSLRYGLKRKSDNKLVALMVLKAENNNTNLNLIRYATSAQVIGGFTKLLSHVKTVHKSFKTITTFSDNLISDGSLYANNGFTHSAYLKPDYMYLYKNARHHKFAFRLKRFKNDPNLKYEEGLTEKQLAVLNNIPRIWDAGKSKWVMVL